MRTGGAPGFSTSFQSTTPAAISGAAAAMSATLIGTHGPFFSAPLSASDKQRPSMVGNPSVGRPQGVVVSARVTRVPVLLM
jgi:hypothetical protein